jgi:hypothetical protein
MEHAGRLLMPAELRNCAEVRICDLRRAGLSADDSGIAVPDSAFGLF